MSEKTTLTVGFAASPPTKPTGAAQAADPKGTTPQNPAQRNGPTKEKMAAKLNVIARLVVWMITNTVDPSSASSHSSNFSRRSKVFKRALTAATQVSEAVTKKFLSGINLAIGRKNFCATARSSTEKEARTMGTTLADVMNDDYEFDDDAFQKCGIDTQKVLFKASTAFNIAQTIIQFWTYGGNRDQYKAIRDYLHSLPKFDRTDLECIRKYVTALLFVMDDVVLLKKLKWSKGVMVYQFSEDTDIPTNKGLLPYAFCVINALKSFQPQKEGDDHDLVKHFKAMKGQPPSEVIPGFFESLHECIDTYMKEETTTLAQKKSQAVAAGVKKAGQWLKGTPK